jgi:hypothetical protein
MAFRFVGIEESVAAEVRDTMRAPGYGHPAHREIATGYGPCRVCLRTFQVGIEERILFTYQPFTAPGSLPSPAPVFIHSSACVRYDASEPPPDFLALPLVVEGYAREGRLLDQERVGDEGLVDVLERAFSRGIAYAHVRNGEAGCFMARVERSSGASMRERSVGDSQASPFNASVG